MTNNIAIIPARGGSKRIPGKNIRSFHGKPVIAYSIQTALDTGIFDKVLVSTDDPLIAEIAVAYGASVPFYRSSATSGDHSTTADVLTEVLTKLGELGTPYDYACCIYPTAPLLTADCILTAFNHLRQSQYISVFPVCEFSYSIWRSLGIDATGTVHMNFPENRSKRSQDLPKSYHDAGQFYWVDVPKFMVEKELFTSNSGVIELTQLQVQDIDNLSDWVLAELKYSFLNRESE